MSGVTQVLSLYALRHGLKTRDTRAAWQRGTARRARRAIPAAAAQLLLAGALHLRQIGYECHPNGPAPGEDRMGLAGFCTRRDRRPRTTICSAAMTAAPI